MDDNSSQKYLLRKKNNNNKHNTSPQSHTLLRPLCIKNNTLLHIPDILSVFLRYYYLK